MTGPSTAGNVGKLLAGWWGPKLLTGSKTFRPLPRAVWGARGRRHVHGEWAVVSPPNRVGGWLSARRYTEGERGLARTRLETPPEPCRGRCQQYYVTSSIRDGGPLWATCRALFRFDGGVSTASWSTVRYVTVELRSGWDCSTSRGLTAWHGGGAPGLGRPVRRTRRIRPITRWCGRAVRLRLA